MKRPLLLEACAADRKLASLVDRRGRTFCATGVQRAGLLWCTAGESVHWEEDEPKGRVCRLHSGQSEAVLTSGPAMILTDTVCLPGSVSSISTLCFILRSVVSDEGGQEWKGGIGGLS